MTASSVTDAQDDGTRTNLSQRVGLTDPRSSSNGKKYKKRHGKIPEELRRRNQWVGWRSETRKDKPAKVPVNPKNGCRAKTNDPQTWGSYEDACEAVERLGLDGIGFVLKEGGGLVYVDLDRCRDPDTSKLASWAGEVCGQVNSYTAVSSSGCGLQILAEGVLPIERSGFRHKIDGDSLGRKAGDEGGEKPEIEMYQHTRFVAITGDHLPNSPSRIEPCQRGIDRLVQKYHRDRRKASRRGKASGGQVDKTQSAAVRKHSTEDPHLELFRELKSDSEVLEAAGRSRRGARFKSLYHDGDLSRHGGDHSAADFEQCCIFAFYSRKDSERIDRLFRTSKLLRPKWDEVHSADGRTYGQMTIERAIEDTKEVWIPTELCR